MKIKKSITYQNELKEILKYIAKDKINASKNFRKNLNIQIKNLVNFPYKYRQSIYFDNEDIRDMIFQGYTIIYEVNLENQQIEILSIFNQNKPDIVK